MRSKPGWAVAAVLGFGVAVSVLTINALSVRKAPVPQSFAPWMASLAAPFPLVVVLRAGAGPLPSPPFNLPAEVNVRSRRDRVHPRRLPLQRLPHVLVPLRGPDARMNVTRCFIVGAADVEGQTMIKDHPMSELRL